jgi:hypothetical protein
MYMTNNQALQFNSATVSQVIDVPGSATVSYTAVSGSLFTLVQSTAGTFLGGIMLDGGGSSNALLPAKNTVSGQPPSIYLCTSNGMLSTSTYFMNILCVGFSSPIYGRIWYNQTTGSPLGWNQTAWYVISSGVQVMQLPWFYNLNISGFAVEFNSAQATSGYVQCLLYQATGTTKTYPVVAPASELSLTAYPVEWWGDIEFTKFFVAAAGEIITCTASDLNAGGDAAACVPARGTYPGTMPPAVNYYQSASKVVPNHYTGNFKNGLSAFHIPYVNDTPQYANSVRMDDFRLYAIRSTTTASYMARSDTLFNLLTSSAALSPGPGPMCPHYQALAIALQELNLCGDNGDHTDWLKKQAKKAVAWIKSPEGRSALAKGVGAAEKLITTVGPMLAGLL